MLLTWPNGRVILRLFTTTVLPRRYASRPSLDQAIPRASPLPAFARFAPSGLIVQTDVGSVRPLTYAMRFGPHETRVPGACRSDGVPPPAATTCTFVMRRSPVPSGAIAYRLSNGSAQELW